MSKDGSVVLDVPAGAEIVARNCGLADQDAKSRAATAKAMAGTRP